MNCPYHNTNRLPDTEECRENRRDNRLSNGKFCRPCQSCGRDLGPKPKYIGGKNQKPSGQLGRPDAGYEVTGTPHIPNVVRKPAPPTKRTYHKRYLSFMGVKASPWKREPGVKPERHCPNCKFPVTSNSKYCGLCQPIASKWKDSPAIMKKELAKVKYRRDNGLVRKGRGFQGGVHRGWPKGKKRGPMQPPEVVA